MLTDRLIFAGILLLLVFAPLAFGSIHVWAYSIAEFGVFILLSVYIMRYILHTSSQLSWVRTSVNRILLLLLLLIGLQLIPLPASWMAFISPKTFSDKMQLSELPQISIAYSFHSATMEFLKIAAYIGMFFLVLNTLKSKQRIDMLVYVLIFTGLFEAMYAIAQTFSANPMIWWWKSRVGGAKFASGTFIGSNHFAFYLEMILPLTLGYMIGQKKREKRLLPGLGGTRAFIQKVIAVLSPESAHPQKILFFFMSVIIGTALLMSASRGGIISMAASMFFMALLFLSKREYRKYGVLILSLCLIVFIYGLQLGIRPTLDKFKNLEKGAESRLHSSLDAMPVLESYPIFGVGWGNFRHVYPQYAAKEEYEASGYLHNDWLEAGAETGVIGLCLIFAAFFIYMFRMVRLWRQRRNLHAVGIGAGVMTGVLSAAFHSFSDFSMHIPANPLTLSAILALGYAALHRQGHGYGESFFYRTEHIELTPVRQFAAGCIVIMLFSSSAFFIFRHFFAEIPCPTEWNSTLNLNWNPYLTDIQKAISINPDNAEYHFKSAKYYMGNQGGDDALRREFNEKAIANLEEAVRLNPANGNYWHLLGKCYSLRRYDAYDYITRWLPMADRCFDMAVYTAPNDPFILSNAAGYWVWRSKVFAQDEYIGKFQRLFQKALNINPKQWEWAVSQIWEYYPNDAVLANCIPPENKDLKTMVLQWTAKKTAVLPAAHTQITSSQVGDSYRP
jgi:O-antigen ligase